MDLEQLFMDKALQYAKATIKDRAVPYLDGLKPVQRRIVFEMFEMGLLAGETKKSARIVGDVMGKLHPHGDSALYEALCQLESSHKALNAPLVLGQGNFGIALSDPKKGGRSPAQMRYTEAKLAPISAELFDGIKEGAVEFVDNYDNTETEPVILPTRFPNVLVNANKGIAWGVGSYIPEYSLKNACLAVAAYINGKTDDEIIDILGVPDFPIQCVVHSDRSLLKKLYDTGAATFNVTGAFHGDSRGNLILDTVPPGVTYERVMEQLRTLAKTPECKKDIIDIKPNTGLNSTGIFVECKKGIPLKTLMLRILQGTRMRSTVSFRTRVIIDGAPVELSVKQLIEKWVQFRSDCIKNVYKTRIEKLEARIHKAEAWEAINGFIPEVVDILVKSENTAQARQQLGARFNLDDIQTNYILELKIRTICPDNASKELANLKEMRDKLVEDKKVRDDEQTRLKMIVEDLEEIANKYGTERVTAVDDLVTEEEKVKQKRVVPDDLATVFITKRGLVKCIHKYATDDDAAKYMSSDDGLVVPPIYCKQNDYLLIYTFSGCCYKILVDDIDSSRSEFKQYCWELLDRKDQSNICYVCAAGNYDKSFTVIYGNGRGRLVPTSTVSGNRKAYKNQFEPGSDAFGDRNRIFVVPYQCFFMVTASGKVAFGDVRAAGMYSNRAAFKVARTLSNDPVIGFIDASADEFEDVDINAYAKEYCIKPKEQSLIEAVERLKNA